MKTILIIGIGAGDPDYITVQAVKALNRVDVFFLMDKGPAKQKLRALREALCRQHIRDRAYRFAEAESPPRDTAPADYRASVDELNREKQDVFERMIEGEMTDGETAGILVWGDPMLYDSTIRNIEAIAAGGRHQIEYDVIPGITAVQALAARHKIPLNRIAQPVALTTGRKLAEGFPPSTVMPVKGWGPAMEKVSSPSPPCRMSEAMPGVRTSFFVPRLIVPPLAAVTPNASPPALPM